MTTVNVTDFVQTVRDTQPAKVILSVPHDGLWGHNFSGHFEPRTQGVIWADRHVTPIANDILIQCHNNGVTADMVRFLMPRMYVDANRPAPGMAECDRYTATAFVDERVRQYYDKYFAALGDSISRSISAHTAKNILVLDLHGFTREHKYRRPADFDVILGTDHRKTIKHGEPDRALGSYLDTAGFETFTPTEVDTLPDGDPFPGGFISEHLSDSYDVSVIQIEMEKRFRNDNGEIEGKRLASSIGQWLFEYFR